MTPEEAYKQAAKLASEHALIYQGYGGVLVIVHPDTQREQGIYCLCQHMEGRGPHPDHPHDNPYCKCKVHGRGYCQKHHD